MYLLYQYVPLDYQSSSARIPNVSFGTGNLSYNVKQFYPNMKFNHNRISYDIEEACDEDKKSRMTEAFRLLHEQVAEIEFYPRAVETPDIRIICSKKVEGTTGRNFFVAGEGGAEQIIQTKRYNVITKGLVLLYGNPHGTLECSWPNVELHELMHVFGFQHSQNENSLMYPYLESCEQKLDEAIIDDLRALYTQENLPDLYFESVEAIKHGRYLDFNATIKNSGVIEARNVNLAVFDDKKQGESFPLDNIDFGAGITFSVSNAKLNSRYSTVVKIVIDPDNIIKEIDENNNVAILEFN
jgi:predicted Zn-dependent protease